MAVPVRHCSNLPSWPLSICVMYCEWSLPTLSGEGVLSGLFARTTLKQARTFCVNGPSVWNGLPLELRLLSRTLSNTLYNHLLNFNCYFWPFWSRECLSVLGDLKRRYRNSLMNEWMNDNETSRAKEFKKNNNNWEYPRSAATVTKFNYNYNN